MKVKVQKDKQSADSPLLEQRRPAAGESGRRGKIPTTFSLLFEMLEKKFKILFLKVGTSKVLHLFKKKKFNYVILPM
jgi:hypothetical protein